MAKVTYIADNGAEYEVEVTDGWTVMQGATLNGIDGILGECGGSCSCATCHVYVEETFLGKLAPTSETEEEMLDCTVSPREANSRLGCQIKVGPDLDGLVVRLPKTQI